MGNWEQKGKPVAELQEIWPVTMARQANGHLVIGGVSLPALAAEHGTPLYIFDLATIDLHVQRYRESLRSYPAETRLVYAGKAFLCVGLLRQLAAQGLWLDVVSGGELAIAYAAGFPAERLVFHGNNKTEEELRFARQRGVGVVVIDHHAEVELLGQLWADAPQPLSVMVRLNPGVETATHAYRRTGQLDSKFGLPIATGAAAQTVAAVLDQPALTLVGYHVHLGSQLFTSEPYRVAIERLADFAQAMAAQHGVVPNVISPGGGIGVPATPDDPSVDITATVREIVRAVAESWKRRGLPLPALALEPGRSLVAQAGVALYRVGAIKRIPGVRCYVSVDGGMADNIRPALYGARYTAALANREGEGEEIVTIVGKYCESGDVLIRDLPLPPVKPGDLLAVPSAGAYCLAMASNYNGALRPAVIAVQDGAWVLWQRRETYDDLLRRDPLA